MRCILPLVTNFLDGAPPLIPVETGSIWENARACLGAALHEFSRPTVGRVRIRAHRAILGRPATFLFPSVEDFAGEIAVSDSNDVLTINQETPAHYSNADRRDQSLALGSARSLLEQDSTRESLLANIAHAALLPGMANYLRLITNGAMSEITFTRDLAAGRIETEWEKYAPLPRISDIAAPLQARIRAHIPDVSNDDRILPVVAPAFPHLSSHDRLRRLPDLNAQIRLLAEALDLSQAFDLQPIIYGNLK